MGNLLSENKSKLIRTSTVAITLDYLLKGQLMFLNNHYDVLVASGTDSNLKNVVLREGVRRGLESVGTKNVWGQVQHEDHLLQGAQG